MWLHRAYIIERGCSSTLRHTHIPYSLSSSPTPIAASSAASAVTVGTTSAAVAASSFSYVPQRSLHIQRPLSAWREPDGTYETTEPRIIPRPRHFIPPLPAPIIERPMKPLIKIKPWEMQQEMRKVARQDARKAKKPIAPQFSQARAGPWVAPARDTHTILRMSNRKRLSFQLEPASRTKVRKPGVPRGRIQDHKQAEVYTRAPWPCYREIVLNRSRQQNALSPAIIEQVNQLIQNVEMNRDITATLLLPLHASDAGKDGKYLSRGTNPHMLRDLLRDQSTAATRARWFSLSEEQVRNAGERHVVALQFREANMKAMEEQRQAAQNGSSSTSTISEEDDATTTTIENTPDQDLSFVKSAARLPLVKKPTQDDDDDDDEVMDKQKADEQLAVTEGLSHLHLALRNLARFIQFHQDVIVSKVYQTLSVAELNNKLMMATPPVLQWTKTEDNVFEGDSSHMRYLLRSLHKWKKDPVQRQGWKMRMIEEEIRRLEDEYNQLQSEHFEYDWITKAELLKDVPHKEDEALTAPIDGDRHITDPHAAASFRASQLPAVRGLKDVDPAHNKISEKELPPSRKLQILLQNHWLGKSQIINEFVYKFKVPLPPNAATLHVGSSKHGNADLSKYFRSVANLAWNFNKVRTPLVVVLDGKAQGAGAGVFMHSRYRVATENTSISFPGPTIGWFPDGGASYILSRLPGYFGMLLALTGWETKGIECVRLGFATHYCESDELHRFGKRIGDSSLTYQFAEDTIEQSFGMFDARELLHFNSSSTSHPSIRPPTIGLEEFHTELEEIFGEDVGSVEQILKILDQKIAEKGRGLQNAEGTTATTATAAGSAARGGKKASAASESDPTARSQLSQRELHSFLQRLHQQLLSASPLALKVTFQLMKLAEFLPLEKCLKLEYRLSQKMLADLPNPLRKSELLHAAFSTPPTTTTNTGSASGSAPPAAPAPPRSWLQSTLHSVTTEQIRTLFEEHQEKEMELNLAYPKKEEKPLWYI